MNWFHQLFSYAWPFSTWGIFTWAQQASDRWSLKAFGSQADVGAYAVLFQLGYTPIATATGLMVTLLGPILYQRAGDGTDQARNAGVAQTTWRLTWIVIGATIAGSALTFILGDWLFSFLVAKAFRAHAFLLGYMVLAGGLFTAGQILALRTQSDMTVKHTIPVKIGSAVIGVALNIVLARTLGLFGVTLGAVGFAAIYFIWIAMLVRRLELRKQKTLPVRPEGHATPC
jgi:O-antigen/teichoic acid export membrane protein